MIENFASRWTKEETELLTQHLESTDYEELERLFPGRSKSSIRAKQKRLKQANPIPAKFIPFMFKYHLEGEADGQILQRMIKSGYNYTLRDIGIALKGVRKEAEEAYAEEHKRRPTLDQLRDFVEKRNG